MFGGEFTASWGYVILINWKITVELGYNVMKGIEYFVSL
jgi:hypothetical protein